MKNALAVYTSKSSLNGRTLVELAQDHGMQIRFMALGGYILGDPAEIHKKALAGVKGGGLLIVGGFAADGDSIAKFDKLVEQGDRLPVAAMLNAGKLPWCELYTSRFDYDKTVKASPRDKSGIDGSVPRSQLAVLKDARTRYIFYNQSRKKNCQKLMVSLADALATHTNGVVADYQRPSR